jgi:hypothetical protein
MSLVSGLIHAGESTDADLHEAMTALREGRVPDIAPESIHGHPARPPVRWIPSGVGPDPGGLIIRREEDHEEQPQD